MTDLFLLAFPSMVLSNWATRVAFRCLIGIYLCRSVPYKGYAASQGYRRLSINPSLGRYTTNFFNSALYCRKTTNFEAYFYTAVLENHDK